MSSRTIALVAIFLTALLWSTANVVTKILVVHIDPFPLAFMRFTIASLIMLPFLFRQRFNLNSVLKEIVPISLFSTGNILFFYLGIPKTSANAASIIYTTVPIITVIFSYYLIGERTTMQKTAGILLAFVGELVILLLPVLDKDELISGDILGNAFIVFATFSWSFYTIGSRSLIAHRHYSPILVSAVSIFVTALVFGILTFFTPHRDFLAPLASPVNLLLLLHLAILVTVATYLLYQWAIKHASATTASLNNYVSLVFSVLLGVIFLGEYLTTGFIIGSILVILGVFLATGSSLKAILSSYRR